MLRVCGVLRFLGLITKAVEKEGILWEWCCVEARTARAPEDLWLEIMGAAGMAGD